MSDESKSQMAEYLKNHPRMVGALITLFLLLSQAGTVAAGGGSAFSGP